MLSVSICLTILSVPSLAEAYKMWPSNARPVTFQLDCAEYGSEIVQLSPPLDE